VDEIIDTGDVRHLRRDGQRDRARSVTRHSHDIARSEANVFRWKDSWECATVLSFGVSAGVLAWKRRRDTWLRRIRTLVV
jgi:hypothetical protein